MQSNIFHRLAKEETVSESNIFDRLAKEQKIEETEPSFGQEALRHISRTGARIGETIAGLPGDILSLLQLPVEYGLSKIAPEGEIIPERVMEEAERQGKVEEARKLLSEMGLDDEFTAPQPPTSTEMKEVTQYIAGDYLEPQTKTEEFTDEVTKDLTSLIVGRKIPIKGGVIAKTFKAIAKPFLVSLGSNLVKEGVEVAGGGEKAQTYSKLGAMFLLDLTGRTSAKKLKDMFYKKADKAIPENASANARGLSKNLADLEGKLSKGGTTPSKAPVLTKINELQKKINNNRIELAELIEYKRNINEISSSLYDLPKDVKASLKKNFNSLRGDIKSAINEYGIENKPFIESWTKAEELHAAIGQSKQVRHFIEKSIKKYPHLAAVAAGGFGITAPGAALGTAAAGYGLVTGGEQIARIMKSPTLRKYYLKAMKSALAEDSTALIKNLSALDEAMKKEED